MRESTRYRGVYCRRDTRGRARYQIEYKGSDGKRRFQTLPLGTTAKEASEFRSGIVSRLSRGERIAPTRVTVQSLWDEWLPTQANLKPRTVETYEEAMRLYVLPSLGWRRVAEVEVHHVAVMISELQARGLKAWTIRKGLTPLSRLMAHAVRRGLAPQNPVSLLDRSERPKSDQATMRILSSDKINAYLAACTPAYLPLATTALFTGLRIGEILALEWGDVDFEKGEIRVRDSKTNAGRRTIVMVAPVSQALATHSFQIGSDTRELVFRTSTNRALGARNVLRSHYRVLGRAGIPHIRFHDLRHTFASILISQGHDTAFIAEQMGHASINTTHRVYGKLFDREAKAAKMREKFAESFGGVA